MATNADFDSLIVRITTATNTLESDVATINAGVSDIADQVEAAEQAALDAQGYATQAQEEVEQILDLKPILKGEYGEPVNFTTNPVLATTSDFEESYGKLYKLKVGATGVSLNGLPDALIAGWHLYVFNATGTDITISGTETVGGSTTVADGHIARINTDIDNAYHVYDITSGSGGGGATTFTQLTDAPSSYTGQAGKTLVVKGDESGLEFTAGGGGAVDSVNGQTGVVVLDASDVGALADTYVPDWADVTGKPSTFAPAAHVHSASDVNSGTFDEARIPSLAASKVTSGTFAAARIPSLDASKITSGQFPTTRLGAGSAGGSDVLLGSGFWGSVPSQPASFISSGTFNLARIPDLPAYKITTGTLDAARLGTGTPSASTVLLGNGTWGSAPASSLGYPIQNPFKYKGTNVNNWPNANPFESIWIGDCANTAGTITGEALFASSSALSNLPAGKYNFRSADFASGPLSGNLGFIHVDYGEIASGTFQRRAWAYVQSTGAVGNMYVWKSSDGTWNPV